MMRFRHALLLTLLLALLMTAFTSLGPSSSRGPEGLGLSSRVRVEVLMVGLDGREVPVEGALVVIGDRRALTSSDGTATVAVTQGRYSSYFKHPDPRLAVVLMDLVVERDTTVRVVFELRRLGLESASFVWGGNGSSVTLEVDVKNVPKLLVKVFAIDSYRYLIEHQRDVDATIQLDGVVPNHE
ncbi:MAG: hypothetical protein QXM81_05595, partial [Nitrososphaerota archaeon]